MGGGWRYPSPEQPAPIARHRRAEPTIRAAIDTTVALLEELPERHVTFDAIRTRSGVSQGSLTHHFGSRDGLIATAHVERYVRTCRIDEAFLGQLDGRLTDADVFAAAMLQLIDGMLSPERRAVRWLRMSALAGSLHDPALERTLSSAYTSLTDRLSAIVGVAHDSGILAPDVDVRTVALLSSMHAQGLVLDDLIGAEVPLPAWNRLQVRFVASFLTPEAAERLSALSQARYGDLWRAEVFGPRGRLPADTAERLTDLRALHGEPGADGTGTGADDAAEVEDLRALLATAVVGTRFRTAHRSEARAAAQEQVLTNALRQLRISGADGIDVDALRKESGLSQQSFHRLFGDRDALVRMTRIRLEISRAAHSIARFSRMVTESAEPAMFRAELENDATTWMAEEPQRQAMRQRIETLDATRTDQELRAALASVQRVTRDLLVEQVCRAQAQDLIDPTLPARGVARFLDGTPFWHVFHGLDAHRPEHAAWTAMLRRITVMLSPDPDPVTPAAG